MHLFRQKRFLTFEKYSTIAVALTHVTTVLCIQHAQNTCVISELLEFISIPIKKFLSLFRTFLLCAPLNAAYKENREVFEILFGISSYLTHLRCISTYEIHDSRQKKRRRKILKKLLSEKFINDRLQSLIY